MSTALLIFSPTTEPIDPPINLKSIHAITTFSPPDLPMATLIASFKPVFFLASLVLCLYDLLSLNFKGSLALIFSSISLKLSSKKILKYS